MLALRAHDKLAGSSDEVAPVSGSLSRRDADVAALAWQFELGADEAIADLPFDRFTKLAAKAAAPPVVALDVMETAQPLEDPSEGTAGLASGCRDLEELRAAMAAFEGCALKRGARNLVFAGGNPRARVMVIGEAPGREEDRAGLPFVGRSGVLLDRMLAAIGLARDAQDAAQAAYITNILPWRPPQNRDPASDEVAMMMPFLFRHIELKAPEMIVLMGSAALRCVLGASAGITRMRGIWTEWRGVPVLPMNHPAALLRNSELKRAAWGDLLALRARLDMAEGR